MFGWLSLWSLRPLAQALFEPAQYCLQHADVEVVLAREHRLEARGVAVDGLGGQEEGLQAHLKGWEGGRAGGVKGGGETIGYVGERVREKRDRK